MRWLADVAVDPDEARRRAAEILAGPEFRPPRRGVVERVLGWIGRQLARLFGTLSGGGGGAVLGWLVVLAAIVGLVVLVVVGLRRAGGRVAPPEGDTVVEHVARRSADEWRAEAATHAAAGRWRDALRCRYRAAVSELGDRGVVVAVAGTTTGRERSEVADRAPALTASFATVADAFDRGMFGGDPLGPEALVGADALDRALARADEVSGAPTTTEPTP